ncbi:hypothetical protein ACFL6M_07230, partial [Candidatus Eisenbacteria bacterium]
AEEIQSRYLTAGPGGAIAPAGINLTLQADYPHLKMVGRGPMFPVIIGGVGLLWMLGLALYLRACRASVSNKRRGFALAGIMIVLLLLHMDQFFIDMGGIAELWVSTAFWGILIRYLAETGLLGTALTWIVSPLLLLGAYRFAQRQFLRAEAMVTNDRTGLGGSFPLLQSMMDE